MLSVIICTLNEELYLPKLLDTFNQQENKLFEVIIIDASSNDHTPDVVKKYQSTAKYPVKFFQTGRVGLSRQRNMGVEKAEFEHLLFLDADVLLPPGFIAESLNQILKKGIGLAGTKIYAAEKHIGFRLAYRLYSAFYLPLVRLWNPIIHGCSTFVTKEIHRKTGGFKENVTFEDFRFAVEASKFYRSRLLDKVYVRTSARRFYKFNPAELSELLLSGIYSIFKAGIDGKKGMKRFHENYGKHQSPKY